MMVLTYSVTTRAIERGPQLKSKRVSLQQRGKRASQAKAKSSRILNSAQGLQLEHTDLAAQELCKTKPRDSTTDRQAAASFNSPPCPYNVLLDVRAITIHCYCSFTACVPILQSSVSLTGVTCKQHRWVIFPRKHLLDIFYFKSDSKALSSASKTLDKQHKITNRV